MVVGEPPEIATDTYWTHGPVTVPEIVHPDEQLAAVMVMVELMVLVRPLASVTLMVAVWLAPAVVGVPCTVTELLVLADRLSPAGNATGVQVNGPTPPASVTAEL